MGELMGQGDLRHWSVVGALGVRLLMDLVGLTIVAWALYARIHRNRELVFSCVVLNVTSVSLCLLLRRGSSELGFALALFGVFGMLRYRTETIRTRDLTYLFLAIAVGLVNGVADRSVSIVELAVVNGVLIGVPAACELGLPGGSRPSMPIAYDRLDLISATDRRVLFADLEVRLGCPIAHVDVHRLDLLRDVAELTVYFDAR